MLRNHCSAFKCSTHSLKLPRPIPSLLKGLISWLDDQRVITHVGVLPLPNHPRRASSADEAVKQQEAVPNTINTQSRAAPTINMGSTVWCTSSRNTPAGVRAGKACCTHAYA